MTPKIIINLGGKPLGEIDKRALSGQIVEHEGENADELRLTVSNFDGQLQKPRRGETVTVEIGFEESGVIKAGEFTIGEVVKRGALATFEITGHAADLKKTMKKQKTRSWLKDKKLGDVVKQVAKDNGLKPAISEKLAALKIVKGVYQTNESDMHLLTRLARKCGGLFKIASGNLLFVERGAGQTAGGGAAETATITPNDIDEQGGFRISDKDRPQRAKVKADYYDRGKATRKTIESQAGGDGDQSVPDFTLPQTFGSEEEAQRAVDAKKAELARQEKSFSGTFRTGFFGAAPGGVLNSQGFGDDDDIAWTVKTRVFAFDAHGILGTFEAEVKKAPGAGGGSGGGGSSSSSSGSTGKVQEAGAAPAQAIG